MKAILCSFQQAGVAEWYTQNKLDNSCTVSYAQFMSKRNYRNYTDEDVINYCKEVETLAGLLKKLGLKACGGNYANIKRLIQNLNINCDHWTTLNDKAWSRGKSLKDYSEYSKNAPMKKKLLKERDHKCEKCLLKEWNGQPIPLEMDHIDGNNVNNIESNLRLLCCNCHAQTPTWRGRKNKMAP